jgi:chaperonin GroEL
MNVASVSSGNDTNIGGLITEAMIRVGRQGVVTMQESQTTNDFLSFVEGMQFQRGYISPYFVTDSDRMICEFEYCRVLVVDKLIENARDMVGLLETAIGSRFPLLIMAVDIEPEGLATLVVNKLRGNLQVVAVKAPGFGERKTEYLEDVAILTGSTLVRDELGVTLRSSDSSILGRAARVIVAKDFCTIVGEGQYRSNVKSRVNQLRYRINQLDDIYEREKLQERLARLSGGVAIINVGAPTETELKEKKLRVEDALCATKAALEEGILVGGGCTLVNLSRLVGNLCFDNTNEDEEKGAAIVRKSLFYPLRQIAHNSGVNGNVVLNKVFKSTVPNFGYNANNGCFEDLLRVGIIDPSKVVRCTIQNAGSVARTFLNSHCVVYYL